MVKRSGVNRPHHPNHRPTNNTNISEQEIRDPVTFQECRAHLGVETQRQWSDRAILRTTPALLGMYSLITLWATTLFDADSRPRGAAWYAA